MKKSLVLMLALPVILLAGCHQANQSKPQQSASSEATTSSASSAAKSSSSTASSNRDAANFSVPKSDQQNKNYVKSGKLTKLNEFSYDPYGTKLTLKKEQRQSRKTANKQLEYSLVSQRVYSNKPTTKAALKAAQSAFSLVKLSNPYTTLQLKFKVTNRLNKPILIDGIKQIKFANKAIITSAAGSVTQALANRLRPIH
ncbi:hypothetical protein [Secundilactobacillus oryzae]|uniref:hypothetical protein n=1 Tax=Secundilactobacillus oryzae TaxID=1202668 RepID=UPI0006D22FCE|nr:hypothetical protein [Secundilactobacillus oryzae]